MVSVSAVESALDGLRKGLAADGFELRAGPVHDRQVQIILAAKPGACLDCLVPDHLMVTMIRDAIRRNDPSVDEVELVKEGFDTPSH